MTASVGSLWLRGQVGDQSVFEESARDVRALIDRDSLFKGSLDWMHCYHLEVASADAIRIGYMQLTISKDRPVDTCRPTALAVSVQDVSGMSRPAPADQTHLRARQKPVSITVTRSGRLKHCRHSSWLIPRHQAGLT